MKKTFRIVVSVNDEEYCTSIKVKAEKVEVLPSYWDDEEEEFIYPVDIDGAVFAFDEHIIEVVKE